MLDHLFDRALKRFWERLARPLANAGVHPDAITAASFVLVLASCAAFVWWHHSLVGFGVCLAAFEVLDNFDGAVARLQHRPSAAGSFLDSVTDRLKEFAAHLSLAFLLRDYLAAMCSLGLSLTVSYTLAKARAEGALSLPGAPPLFERFERLIVLCTGLILPALVPLPPEQTLQVAFWIIAAGSLVTTLQRLHAGYITLRNQA